MTEKIEAYWFAASDRLPHGDGRKVVVGKSHSLRGEIVICGHALHASRHPADALRYAPGPYLHKVLCSGDVVEHDDKLGCRKREYVAKIDATDLLRRFACEQALSVIHLWNAPEVVRQYLETGAENLRLAAARAAYAAYAAAAADAAGYAARAAAYAADAAAADAAAYAAADAARAAAYAADAAAAYAADAAGYADRAAAYAADAAARERFAEMVEEAFAQ